LGSTTRSRSFAQSCCIAFGVLGLILLSLSTEDVEAVRGEGPAVICLTKWGDPPTGAYRTRPAHCDLHTRDTPAFHPTVAVAKRLHWTSWGGRVAVAKGKLGISTYGLADLTLRLSGMREACGRTVYTKAEFVVTTYYDGKKHRGRSSRPIDDCLP
jgi:hypothetical protein